jgi:hypothetical protein
MHQLHSAHSFATLIPLIDDPALFTLIDNGQLSNRLIELLHYLVQQLFELSSDPVDRLLCE